MQRMSDSLLDQINKRFTLNLLIQGAATHTFLTSHHLVKDELDSINPKLAVLYDKLTVGAFVGYWYGDVALICGRPKRFWSRVRKPGHPFSRHPLLVQHGAELAEAAKHQALQRAKAKGVSWLPVVNTVQLIGLFLKTSFKEADHSEPLVELAKRATSMIWGIEEGRLQGALTDQVEFGNIRTPSTRHGKVMRALAIGYGGVVRHGSQFTVVAKAVIWPLLSHELVKGTAELVCLHGLNKLDPETYDKVTETADKIEYETWLMQAGSELWRRLLAVLPDDRTLSENLMRIARLRPQPLERLMMAVIEKPDWARQLIAGL